MIVGRGAVSKILRTNPVSESKKYIFDASNPATVNSAETHFRKIMKMAEIDQRVIVFFTTSKLIGDDEYSKIKDRQKMLYSNSGSRCICIELSHLDGEGSYWEGVKDARIVISDKIPSFIHYNLPEDLIIALNKIEECDSSLEDVTIYVNRRDLFRADIPIIKLRFRWIVRILSTLNRRLPLFIRRYLLIDWHENLEC